MSTTDHAFMKAFGQRDAAAGDKSDSVAVSSVLSAGDTWRHEPSGQRFRISVLPDSTADRGEEARSELQSATQTDTEPTVSDRSAQVEGTVADRIRIDAVESAEGVTPPCPHFDCPAADVRSKESVASPQPTDGNVMNQSVAEAPRAPATLSTSIFQPQWEVDRLRWTETCERLQRKSHHRLSEIVTSLMKQSLEKPYVIGITSYGRGEGRTTISLCLGRIAGGVNAKVAVVDGDLENPGLAERVGVAFDEGWDRLGPDTPLGEAALIANQEQLVMLPIGTQRDIIIDAEMQRRANLMLANLREHFDIIIIDAGPMFTAAHRWFSPQWRLGVNGALIVRDVRSATAHQVDDVCCRLLQANVDNAAIIENFQDV